MVERIIEMMKLLLRLTCSGIYPMVLIQRIIDSMHDLVPEVALTKWSLVTTIYMSIVIH